jgi:hypothetical protein
MGHFRTRASVLTATLVAVAGVLAGCGGGGGDSTAGQATAPAQTAATPTLSKEEYIAQANAICAEVNAAIGTVASTTSDAASQIGQSADLYSGMVERLRGLGDPEDGAGLTPVLNAAADLAQAEQDAQLAAERGDDSALSAAQSDAASALAEFQSAADAYGLTDCGNAPSAPSPTDTGTATSEPSAPVTTTPSSAIPAPAPTPAPAAPTGGTAGGGTSGGGGGGSTGGASPPPSGGVGPG